MIHQELTHRIEAEMETSNISKSIANEVLKSKESYEKQIDILKLSHENCIKRNEELEERMAQMNSKNLTLQSELGEANKKFLENESLLHELEGYKTVASEVHSLRQQLLEIRKKMTQSNIQDEINSVLNVTDGAKSVLDRERGNQRVYESIIEDLRNQLDRMSNLYEECQRKLGDANTKLIRLEEIQVYLFCFLIFSDSHFPHG